MAGLVLAPSHPAFTLTFSVLRCRTVIAGAGGDFDCTEIQISLCSTVSAVLLRLGTDSRNSISAA